ncbi:hypothetical protein O181_051540 [Austropuccinia psidii MF-1]|uniref:40S ribosomal protein S27 n=1 Tax=Austropuccinia psidii MF-1 TaxID=1389203 RepID=A0A9Q3HRW2_9BASI|nr:hypothetical protein [Austropuccinia psidii MF-1]
MLSLKFAGASVSPKEPSRPAKAQPGARGQRAASLASAPAAPRGLKTSGHEAFLYFDVFRFAPFSSVEMTLAVDLLNPSADQERRKHKLKRLVQSPNSYFMDVKCPGCFNITTVFSHAQTVVLCGSCATVLCQPTGGKARLTEGCSFRRKN